MCKLVFEVIDLSDTIMLTSLMLSVHFAGAALWVTQPGMLL